MNEKIVNKWAPIIENCDYKGNKLEQIAMYMESHANIESRIAYSTNNKDELNALPLATKILMKVENLNLDNVIFTCENVPGTDYSVNIKISKEEVMQLKSITGMDLVCEFENRMVEKAAEGINNAIGSLNSPNSEILFNTPRLVKSLSVMSSADANDVVPNMVMILSYNLKSKINN